MIANVPMIFKNIAVIILGGIVLWIKVVNIVKNDDEGGIIFRKKIKQKISKNSA